MRSWALYKFVLYYILSSALNGKQIALKTNFLAEKEFNLILCNAEKCIL